MNIAGLHTLRNNTIGLGKNTVTFLDMCNMDHNLFPEVYLPEMETMTNNALFYRTKTKRHTDLIFEDVHWLLFTLSGELLTESLYDYAEMPAVENPCYVVRLINNRRFVSKELTYIIRTDSVIMSQVQNQHGIEFSCENAEVPTDILIKIKNAIEAIPFAEV